LLNLQALALAAFEIRETLTSAIHQLFEFVKSVAGFVFANSTSSQSVLFRVI
jgi:hypothetical protein